MRILLFLANGFETMEFAPFIDIMGWARNDFGCDIEVDTCGFTPVVTSTFGIPVQVKYLAEDISVNDYDGIAIPGGFEEYGFYEEAYDERLLSLIREFHAAGKIVASICVAALALGKSGILKGKKGTTYHLDGGIRMGMLRDMGVVVVHEPVVRDGHIITSYCPETAPWVAFEVLGMLAGSEIRDKVIKSMGYERIR